MIGVSTACTASAHAHRRGVPADPGGRGQADARGRLRRADHLVRRARLLAARRADDRATTTTPSSASRPFDTRPLRLRARRGRGRGGARGAGRRREARGAHDLRRARGLRLEHERLPDDRSPRPTAAARSSRWTARCRTPGSRRGRSTTSSRTARARPATTSRETQRHQARVRRRTPTKLAVSSPKSMTGHLTCAAGALNLLAGDAARCATASSRRRSTSTTPIPKLDLDYVPNDAREMHGATPCW